MREILPVWYDSCLGDHCDAEPKTSLCSRQANVAWNEILEGHEREKEAGDVLSKRREKDPTKLKTIIDGEKGKVVNVTP